MKQLKLANTGEDVVAQRTVGASIRLLAALAVVLAAVGLAWSMLLAPGTAEAKSYPAAEKKIERAISKGRPWVNIRSCGVPWKLAYKLYMKVVFKKPGYIVKADSVRTWHISGESWSYGIEIRYRNAKQRKALNNKAKAIVRIASGCDSQRDKAAAIHDAIIAGCSYDWDSYLTGDYAANTGNAYGCLVEGSCVCAGYAEAFQLIALRAGLKSVRVGSGNHAWNLVRIDGKWYHIDSCWDDTSGSARRWFLKGSKTIAGSHHPKVSDWYSAKVSVSKEDYADPELPLAVVDIQEKEIEHA